MKFPYDRDRAAYNKARKRLSKVASSDVRLWADSALWSIQEALDVDRRNPDPAALDTVRTGAITLLAAVDALLDKTS